jgi:hypothetical protein
MNRVLLDSFQYQERWTFEDLVQLHVPSVDFRTVVDLRIALNCAVVEGKLEVDANGVYTVADRTL